MQLSPSWRSEYTLVGLQNSNQKGTGRERPHSKMEERLRGRSGRMIQVETQKEKLTAQHQFTFEVGEALNRTCEELESTCEGVNRDFAREVKLAASKHGMSGEQVGTVLVNLGRNTADISTGPGRRLPGSITVIDVLLFAYETVLDEDEANRIYKCIENAGKEA